MKIVEFCSIDTGLAKAVCLLVEEKLKAINIDNVKVIKNDDTVLGKSIKLIRSYRAIPINRQSWVFLEAAREYENNIENIEPIKNTEVLVLKANSFMTDIYILRRNLQVKKLINRNLIKRMIIESYAKPEYIFYIAMDVGKHMKERFKKTIANPKFRFENTIHGPGIVNRNSSYEKILTFIKEKHGVNSSIIDSRNKDLDKIADEVVAILVEKDLIVYKLTTEEKEKINESSTEKSETPAQTQ